MGVRQQELGTEPRVKGGEVGVGLVESRDERRGSRGNMDVRCRSSSPSFSKLANSSSVQWVRPRSAGLCHSSHALGLSPRPGMTDMSEVLGRRRKTWLLIDSCLHGIL